MTAIPDHELNDGTRIPAIGFGTNPLRGDDGERAIIDAIHAGYRLLDTAVRYRNEAEVGQAISASAVPRSELVVATKLPGRHHGFDETLSSFEQSRTALELESIDLYLIHWPNPKLGKFVDSWRAMVELRDRGLVRTIGVSNFTPEHLLQVFDATGVMPAVNQVEMHPFFPQVELRAFHQEHEILTEAWAPLGYRGQILEQAPIRDAAKAHGVTPAQIVLRWHTQLGAVPIPKSADPERRRRNLDIFGFELTNDEVIGITALRRADGRLSALDPDVYEDVAIA